MTKVRFFGAVPSQPVQGLAPGIKREVLTAPCDDSAGKVWPKGSEFVAQCGGYDNTAGNSYVDAVMLEQTKAEAVAAEIAACRDASANCWEMAADTARDDAAAKEFIAAWDGCIECYDKAIAQLEGDGAFGESSEAYLEAARALEADGGDDQHARKALQILAAFRGVTVD